MSGTNETERTLASGDIGAWLDRWQEKHRRETQEKIALMRASGREPASREGQVCCGCPTFSFTLRWPKETPGQVEIRLRAQDRKAQCGQGDIWIWGHPWPEPGAYVDALRLLRLLADHGCLIGRPYLRAGEPDPLPEGAHRVILALDRLIDRSDLPAVRLVVGGEIGLFAAGHGQTSFGAETLIVVEVKALGDQLAAGLRATENDSARETVAAWAQVRDLIEVWPFTVEGPDGEPLTDDLDEETAFYAQRIGLDPALWRRGALWVASRRWLAARGEEVFPTPEEESTFLCLPERLPDEDEVAARVARVRALYGETAEDFATQALKEHCLGVRAALYYAPWPDLGRWAGRQA